MADGDAGGLTEAEAARVWELAAQLQSRADGDEDVSDPRTGAGPAPAASGYSLTQVRSAAAEAGIGSDFVEAALVEVRQGVPLSGAGSAPAWARVVLGDAPAVLSATRTIHATPDAVLGAMQEVLQADPFRLALTDRQGDPLQGGTLVFDAPGMKSLSDRSFAFDMADSGVRQVFVSLRPRPDGDCDIVVRGPVTAQNQGTGLGTLAGLLGGGALGAVGLATGLGAAAVAVGALLGGGLGVRAFRGLYSRAMRRSTGALDRLAGSVGARATGGILGPTEPDGSPRISGG